MIAACPVPVVTAPIRRDALALRVVLESAGGRVVPYPVCHAVLGERARFLTAAVGHLNAILFCEAQERTGEVDGFKVRRVAHRVVALRNVGYFLRAATSPATPPRLATCLDCTTILPGLASEAYPAESFVSRCYLCPPCRRKYATEESAVARCREVPS